MNEAITSDPSVFAYAAAIAVVVAALSTAAVNIITALRTSKKLELIQSQGTAIHKLVNSNMTEAKKDSLDSMVHERAMIREVMRLNRLANSEPSPEAVAELEALDHRIVSLQEEIAARLAAEAEAATA